MTDLILVTGAAATDAGAAASIVDVIKEWAKVDSTWQFILVIFGVFAQTLFFGRWIVQLVATEKRGESHMPELFWWMSLAGATMLFTYFLLRGEPVGMLGQSVGWAVYMRNLYHVRKKQQHRAGRSSQ